MIPIVPSRLKPLAFATLIAISGSAAAGTFTVVNTAGSGVGSLANAVTLANASCVGAPHLINFAIPAGPFIISPGGGFTLNCATVVDGYTQLGASANTVADPASGSNAIVVVQIDATGITGGNVFTFNIPGSALRGLNIRNFTVPGSVVAMASGGTVAGNFLGTDVSGNSCTGAGMKNGILLSAGGTVGGPAPADRNVIGCAGGALGGQAVVITGGPGVVQGNLIGKGAAGGAIPNAAEAVAIGPCLSCFSNTVGGTTLGQGNILANSAAGVRVFTNANSTITGNDIFSNTVGIDLPGPSGNSGTLIAPTITTVNYMSGTTTIGGTLSSSFANQSGISVDFFQNLSGGLDEGEQYTISASPFSTNGAGAGVFSSTIGTIVRNPTVTFSTSSSTSPFSAPRPTPESVPSVVPTFPSTTLGSSSSPQMFAFSNATAAALTLTMTNSNPAEFKDSTGGPPPSAAHYCGIGSSSTGAPLGGSVTIPASGSCNLNMIFSPSGVGARAATFTVNSNAPQNPQAFALTGTGAAAAAPSLSISPASLPFGTVTIATTAGPLTATLTNVGAANLTFSGAFTVTGDYAQTTACPPVLTPSPAPGSSCAVDVTFTPTVTGPRPGTLTILSNSPSSPDTVVLSGTGSTAPVPVVSLAPPSLTFAPQSVSTTSAPQTATLTNTGSATLNISSLAANGDFAFTTTCGTSLPPSPGPGNSCPITVTFTPVVAGARAGSITIADNASGSPHVLSLSGTGTTAPVATITTTPPAVVFPATQVGATSAQQILTIGNAGGAALTISALQLAGTEFVVSSNGCTAPVATGGTCLLGLQFTPSASGARGTSLRIISNATTSPTLVTLTGSGTALPTGTLAADPPAVVFVDGVVGTTSAPQPVSVTNTGVFNVTVSTVSASGDFTQTNDCTILAPGGSCTVTTVFAPTGVGTRNGAVTIVSDASNPALTVSLLGNGVLTNFPVIQLSATALGFGNRVMGIGSTGQTVTLRNAGGANLVINRIYTQGDFRQTSDCPTSVVPGGTCLIGVSFFASIPGSRTGHLFVDSNATTVPKAVDLAGNGCRFFSLTGSRIGSLVCF